jgi:hypothetical protein
LWYFRLSFLLDSDRFEGAPDSNTGRLKVPSSQQFIDNPECHHGIRSVGSI